MAPIRGIIVAVLILFSSLVVVVASTPFVDCGSKGAAIVDVHIGDCKKLPCFFKKGTNVSIGMDFKAKMVIKTAMTQIKAKVGPLTIGYTLPDYNSCHFMKCPVKKGGHATYKQQLFIKKSYPPSKTDIEWKLVSGKEVITCFKFTAVVQ